VTAIKLRKKCQIHYKLQLELGQFAVKSVHGQSSLGLVNKQTRELAK